MAGPATLESPPIVKRGRAEAEPPRPSNPLADLFAQLALWGAAAGVLFLVVNAYVPPQHLPWTPLRLADPVGAATAVKLLGMEGDPAACRAVLGEAGVRTVDQPDRQGPGFCGISDAVSVRGGTTPLRPAGPVLTCPAALSFAVWERQVVRPAAREVLGAELSAVEHYGTYACRTVGGREGGRPSQHATANALDVAGFRLADGRRVTVASDWVDDGPEGRFLRRVRDGACGTWETVLGPEYNAAHRDHFHLDRGPYRVCR